MTCFRDLLSNPREEFLSASELLLRFAENVLRDESNPKYRSIRLENKIFQEKILPINGAVQCLFGMGFEEDNDRLVLPVSTSLDSLEALRDALLDERESLYVFKSVDCFPPVRTNDPLQNFNPVIRTRNQRTFYQRLKSSAVHVHVYEDPKMIQYCLSKIPLDRLSKEAKEKSRASTVDQKDCLLLLLLNWFKSEFFVWMNQPNCDICNAPTQGIGNVPPSEEDRRWDAGIVENYICRKCNRTYRFPRYNHPQKLLETKTGRCGEWANCFSACCRAVGFETRHVLDWTDHVWAEVYSEHQKRWLHCDPCENVCDKPLLYEAGWGKKLSYVIAFSKDEVVDVTWRYSQNHKEVLSRRNEVEENWLVSLWMSMSKMLQSKNTSERNSELEKRRIVELVGFLTAKSASDEERIGRQSGSMAWRLIRGEAGIDASNSEKNEDDQCKNVFVATLSELEQGRMKVAYCAATDRYTRGTESDSAGTVSIQGWANGTARSNGIFRKVEHDWKMVYLARQQGISHGKVSWKFRIDDSSYFINQIEIKASSNTFENGKVEWFLENDTVKEEVPTDNYFISTKFKGCKEISLVAHLEGGNGDVAWQHAQLFRQELGEDIDGLDVSISFDKRCGTQ